MKMSNAMNKLQNTSHVTRDAVAPEAVKSKMPFSDGEILKKRIMEMSKASADNRLIAKFE
jgi:hypothetical protein